MADAKSHEELGNEANSRKDYPAARSHFNEAYKLSPKPKFLVSAANMDLRIGSPEALREAKQWYTQLDQMVDLPQKVRAFCPPEGLNSLEYEYARPLLSNIVSRMLQLRDVVKQKLADPRLAGSARSVRIS